MSRIFRLLSVVALSVCALTKGYAQETLQVLPNSASDFALERHSAGATVDQLIDYGTHKGVQVTLQRNQSRARFTLPTPLNATGFEGIMMEVENVGTNPAAFDITIRSNDGVERGIGTWDTTPPGRRRRILAWFTNPATNVPYRLGFALPSIDVPFQVSYIANGQPNFTAFRVIQIWNGGSVPFSLRVHSIQFVKRRTNYNGIIDKYGQASYLEYPGKVHSDAELIASAEVDRANLAAKAPIDPLGGIPGMRPTRATGRWRIERSPSGRFFVVTPAGKRMWIMGVNTVVENNASRYQNRDAAFQEVTPRTPANEEVIWLRRGHLTDGVGWAYDFVRNNHSIKYGQGWRAQIRPRAVDRLKRWGFNAITGGIDGATPVDEYPMVLACQLANFNKKFSAPYIMHYLPIDVFDPTFEAYVETSIRDTLAYANGKTVIGLQVDNELSWGLRGNQTLQYSVPIGILNSAGTLAAKPVFVNWLKTKYKTVEALNTSWGTSYASFDAMLAPLGLPTSNLNANIRADLSLLLAYYVDKYFSTVKRVLNKVGYRGLFFGTRDAPGATPREVWRAASRYVDAITVNLYTEDNAIWREVASIPKPVMIGEYNYNSSAAGYLGWMRDLICFDEQERAERNYQYLVRAAQTPNIIGACWWSYAEVAPIGRWWDDERLQTGLVDVKDSPYEGLVSGFRNFMMNLATIRRP